MDQSKKDYLVLYVVLTVVVSFLCAFVFKSDAGSGRRILAAVLSVPTGFIGAMIGDFIRRLTIPDAIFTTGGLFAILKERLFWFCVPQLAGMVVGIVIVLGKVLH